jgi:hypothetical protein
MSRIERSNERFMIAFGVDRVTSAYVQVWAQPHEEQDTYLLAIDNLGVHLSRTEEEPAIPLITNMLNGTDFLERVCRLVTQFERRFSDAKRAGNPYPNLGVSDILEVAQVFGFRGVVFENAVHSAID